MLKVNESKVEQAVNYFLNTLDFMTYLEEWNLLEKHNKTSHGVDICCPFHSDSDPSMKIDLDRNLYKCFVCGKVGAGNLIHFIARYKKLVLNQSTNFYNVLDLLIKSSPKHISMLGFNSVFDNLTPSLSEIRNLNLKTSFNTNKIIIKDFNTISKKLKEIGDYSLMVQAIGLMQDGFPPELIYDTLFGKGLSSSNDSDTSTTDFFSNLTLEDLMGDDE